MFTRIEKRREKDLFIVTSQEEMSEFSAGAVWHPQGSMIVNINSNTSAKRQGVTVSGKENIQMLRDALIEICQMEGI